MRILHVVATGTRRGAEMFASDLARTLSEQGVSQQVVLLHGTEAPAVAFEAPTTMLPSNGRTAPGLRIDLMTLRALRDLIADWRPTIVQAHGGEPLKYSVLAEAGRGTPIVYRRIGSVAPQARARLRRKAHARLIRRAARVVAVAEIVRQEAIEAFRIPPDRIVTIPRGIDGRRLQPAAGREATRRALGIPATAPVMLSLGALAVEKDPLAHLKVAAGVLRRHPDAAHLIAGDGPMRAEVEEAVRKRGLNGSVLLLGSRADVPDLLAASDVMLLASRSEGMPGCLIEAGMAGLPVAAYGVGGVPEVVVDGVTGLIAPPGDPAALTDSVLRILGDQPARQRMGDRARDRCSSLFDIRVIGPRYLRLYEEVVRTS